jgi:8-oxo-dGTP pyrophosphatase MutT (NUDIX family)
MSKSNRLGNIQYGALAYRVGADGEPEVLLLTSRGAGRWVIPKGWPMVGRKPRAVVLAEAHQEAGIKGIVGRKPIGSYHYTKSMIGTGARLCECIVFLMLVTEEAATWREQAERRRAWFPKEKAAELVNEGALAVIIRNLRNLQHAPEADRR